MHSLLGCYRAIRTALARWTTVFVGVAVLGAVMLSALPVPSGAQAQQVQANAAPSQQKVTGREISTLIRSTLLAVHQANITGNYTVLRDLGALSFQSLNSAARLGMLFTKIRNARLDLSPAVLIDAVMTKKPAIDGNGLLMLEGRVPSQPLDIVFKMAFRFEGGRWRIFSLGIGAAKPGGTAGLEKAPDPAAQKKAAASGKAKAAKPKTPTKTPTPKPTTP